MTKRGNGDGRPYFDVAKGRWYVSIELPRTAAGRRRRRKVSGATRTEARDNARQARATLAAGLPLPDAKRTTREYLRWWADNVLPGTVSEGTEDTYRRTLECYVIPNVGAVPLASLAPGHVTDMLRNLETDGYSANTRSLARRVLRRALHRAELEGHVARNVASLVEGPKMAAPEGRTLTAEQARALLGAAKDDRLEGAFVLTLALGLRRGEVLGLAWNDVDFDASPPCVHVRRQLQRRPKRAGGGLALTQPKTRASRRLLYLPAEVVDVLRSHRARQASERLAAGELWADTEGLVFTTPLGTPVDPDNFKHHVSAVARKAGLGHWHPHELRHSAASLLLAMDVPLKVVSETLGHTNISLTADTYAHLLRPAKQEAAQAMSAALWGTT